MDSKPTLQWSTSSIALDPRVPVYLDDFLKFDSESFDVIFMDPEAGPKLLSFGLRGMQDFLLNTFIDSEDAIEDLVDPAFGEQFGELVCMCKNAVKEVMDSIEELRVFEAEELPKRKAAAAHAAKKIMAGANTGDAKKDARRVEVAENWLKGELGRLHKRNADLEQGMHSATRTAAARLNKTMNMLESGEAFAVSFLDRLEVWRQMDASQRTALRVVMDPNLDETQVDLMESSLATSQAHPDENAMLSDTQRTLRLSSKLDDEYMAMGESWEDTLPDADMDTGVASPGQVDMEAATQPSPHDDAGDGPEISTDGDGAKVSTESVPDQKGADHSGERAEVSTESVPDQRLADHSGDGAKVSTESVPDQKAADHNGDGAKVSTESVADQKAADHSGDGAKVSTESVADQKAADHSGDGAKVSTESIPDQKGPDHSGDGAKVFTVPDTVPDQNSGDGPMVPAEFVPDQNCPKKADHSGDGAKVPEPGHSVAQAEISIDGGSNVSATADPCSGLAQHLESLLDPGVENDKDGCVSESDSVIIADDAFLEAELSRMILKAMYMCA